MGARESEGSPRIEGQIEGSRFGTTKWFVLVLCALLIVLAFPIFVYENHGILIYVSDDPPNPEEMDVINEWMKVPVVEISYSGPRDLLGYLREVLEDCGILEGAGSPLFVRVDTDGTNLAVWMGDGDRSWDNYTSLAELEDATEVFRSGLEEIVGCGKFPEKGFEIEFSPSRVRARLVEGATPVVFEFSAGESYEVVIDGEATVLRRGFYEVEGVRFFAGKEGIRIDTAKFFEGTDFVYPVGGRFLVLKGGKLSSGVEVEGVPVGIWDGFVVYAEKVVGQKPRKLRSTAIDVHEDVILEADGSLEDVEGKWRTKVSCTPLEWCWRDGRLCLLDICGNYREIDLKTKTVVREKRMAGAVGFDFEEGKPIPIVDENFCVVKGKRVMGNCVRLHNGYAIRIEDGRFEILGRGLVLEGKEFKVVNGFLVVKGDRGVWVVSFGR